jgi:pectinesterase inhibitor-like protein
MSTFSDFGPLTERRRAELQQKKRKRMMLAGVSVFVVLVVIIAGVAVVTHQATHGASNSSKAKPSNNAPATTQMHAVSKSVEMICSPTDYKDVCVKSISKVTNTSSSPKDVIKAAVAVIGEELGNAFSVSELLKSRDPRIKQAIADCKEHYENVKAHLASTLDGINMHKLDDLPTRCAQTIQYLL